MPVNAALRSRSRACPGMVRVSTPRSLRFQLREQLVADGSEAAKGSHAACNGSSLPSPVLGRFQCRVFARQDSGTESDARRAHATLAALRHIFTFHSRLCLGGVYRAHVFVARTRRLYRGFLAREVWPGQLDIECCGLIGLLVSRYSSSKAAVKLKCKAAVMLFDI